MSCMRIIIINQFVGSRDTTWDWVQISNWNAIEINSAVVVSCLIVLRPLFRKVAP